MFFHEDLNFYKNEKFRSLTYVKELWESIQFEIIYMLGLIRTGNITLTIESDSFHISATTSFFNIINKEISLNISHCLTNCLDFEIEININLIDSNQKFYVDCNNCKFYFCKDNKEDEGFIEFNISSNLKIDNLQKFKTFFFLNLVKELQYVINKNVFYLQIEKEDALVTELDADYEIIRTQKFLTNKKIEDCFEDKEIKKRVSLSNLSLIKDFIKNLN